MTDNSTIDKISDELDGFDDEMIASSGDNIDFFAELDEMIAALWHRATLSEFWRHVTARGFDRDLYRDLMVQVFHYTRWNSVNQAATVLSVDPSQRHLLRFIYRHADGELGHERMVVHDLRSAGLLAPVVEIELLPRVPATTALIGYLASLCGSGGAVARLGYSYWAESVYQHLAPLLGAASTSLGLTARQMTFFTAHSEIDAGHADDVRLILARTADNDARRATVAEVTATTLWLTLQIMDQTFAAWKDRTEGAVR